MPVYRQLLILSSRVSHNLEQRTNIVSGYGPARRTDKKRRSSPPIPSRTGSPTQFATRSRNARHESTRANVSSVTTDRPNHGMTKSEFEFCRQSLKTVFQKCTDVDFVQLSIVFSCLLNSFRALHVFEIAAILVILLGNESGGEVCGESGDDSTMRRLQATCSQIFFFDPAGFVHFAHPLIPKFLLSYPVRGIDRSHAVLAKACVAQLELDGGIPDFGAEAAVPPKTKTGRLSTYAAENWQGHYRLVEKRSPCATAQVHRMLWTQVMKISRCTGCGVADGELRRGAVAQAREFCAARNLRVLSTSYTQVLAGLAARSSVEVGAGECRCASSGISDDSDLDCALAELELTESDSDSDSWSLV